MGYRLEFGIDVDAGGRTLQAKVRGLVDRLGSLGTLAFAACRDRRLAVIDAGDTELYRPFAEDEARRRGYEVRCFRDIAAAMAWLNGADH